MEIILGILATAGGLVLIYLSIEADKQNKKDYRDYKAGKSL
jgi:threonine/homoserine/homoserine lactone efflux protein